MTPDPGARAGQASAQAGTWACRGSSLHLGAGLTGRSCVNVPQAARRLCPGLYVSCTKFEEPQTLESGNLGLSEGHVHSDPWPWVRLLLRLAPWSLVRGSDDSSGHLRCWGKESIPADPRLGVLPGSYACLGSPEGYSSGGQTCLAAGAIPCPFFHSSPPHGLTPHSCVQNQVLGSRPACSCSPEQAGCCHPRHINIAHKLSPSHTVLPPANRSGRQF